MLKQPERHGAILFISMNFPFLDQSIRLLSLTIDFPCLGFVDWSGRSVLGF